jgi:phosphate transport system permease protein
MCCSASILATGIGLFLALVHGAFPSIRQFGVSFFLSPNWNPATQEFGALSSLYGTVMSSAIALLLAIPLSVLIALFLVELASPFLSRILGTAIDVLAAIPSIIFGIWGVFVFAPFSAKYIQPALARFFHTLPIFQGPPSGIGLFTAGIILALMILPFMASLMKDVFSMTPPLLKEAAYGIGATDWEVMRDVSFRYGWQGIIGACLLGAGRALGETIAVAFVIGNSSKIAPSLFAPANTIASRLVNEFSEAADPIYMSALIELGLILLVITFVLQVITHLWRQRMRQSAGGRVA